jgi:hypothetical protein|tara:strand:- start:219 stop:467 length:249 start_codon:yes stop_codon:yes gene_type:complete
MNKNKYTDDTLVVYIKYTSAVILLVAMIFHVAGITPWNSIIQMIGALGWLYVGYKWKENAVILNFLPQFFIIIPMLLWMYVD